MCCDLELVSAFLDGELDRTVLGVVTHHLLQCDDCCQNMGQLARVKDGIADRFVLRNPEEMTQSVMMAIQNDKVAPHTGPRTQRLKRRNGSEDDCCRTR